MLAMLPLVSVVKVLEHWLEAILQAFLQPLATNESITWYFF